MRDNLDAVDEDVHKGPDRHRKGKRCEEAADDRSFARAWLLMLLL